MCIYLSFGMLNTLLPIYNEINLNNQSKTKQPRISYYQTKFTVYTQIPIYMLLINHLYLYKLKHKQNITIKEFN